MYMIYSYTVYNNGNVMYIIYSYTVYVLTVPYLKTYQAHPGMTFPPTELASL